ncbi:YmfQ family protein [Cohnella sp. WQ 127256]|uniref:YmfQ family protein n=1 Tax=Cohnella sp. WQ 127256 TaxID=2938790 RepID=UPI002117A3C3|nr:YmfQ family protein [Cohnella sp. WQ 127256]
MNSIRGKEMMTYLPDYYATSRVMSSNMDAQGTELDKLWQAMDETLEQYFVSTATWGLELWEKELGISVDISKPTEQRRSVILSKLRGIGTVTVSLIKSVAEAYDGGTVEVTVQPETYKFNVKFIDTLGVPPNLDDLKAVIEDIKPAHLAVEYSFTYTPWGELKQTSWDSLSSFTWEEVMTRSWC